MTINPYQSCGFYDMMMKIMMLTVTLNIRNTVNNMNHVLQLELI